MILSNPRYEAFAQHVATGKSLTDAAIAAGYTERSAGMQGSRLMKIDEVAARVTELGEKAASKAELTATRVLEELRRLAFVDIRGMFDAQGNLIPIKDLTEEQAAAIAGFEVIKKNAEAGDGLIDTVHKVRLLDKTRSLEMLAKHFRLLIERVEHSGNVEFTVVTGVPQPDGA